MEAPPIRVYGPNDEIPVDTVCASLPASAEDKRDPLSFPELDPFNIGPVTVYPGLQPRRALRMGNAWRFLKQATEPRDAQQAREWARRAFKGWSADEPCRPPAHENTCAARAVWRNRQLTTAEARILIYVPLYVEALCRDPKAMAAYKALRAAHKRALLAGKGFALKIADSDVLTDVELAVTDPDHEMNHAPVLAALLEDRLLDHRWGVGELVKTLSIWDMPPNLAPLREAEQLPGMIGGAVVYYRPAFLNNLADRYFGAFVPGGAARIPWERRTLMMYGREAKEGHDTAFFGDPGTSYRYTGKNHAPLPWETDATGTLKEILEIVRLVSGKPFNFCLMNLYDKSDSIGKHSDDERDLVEGAGVFSVSLGRERRFVMEPMGGAGARGTPVSQRLAHGSVIWMTGLTQRAYKHSVPAETGADKKRPGQPFRVNLTFRCVVVRR